MHRAAFFVLIAGVLALSARGLASADTAGAPEVTHAEALYKKGDYKQAISVLTAYLATHAKDADALVDRGDDYTALGDQEAAIADYTAALAINPYFAYAYASRCESYIRLDEDQRATADCDKAIELQPRLAYAYRMRAMIALDNNDGQAALADANQALKLAPGSSLALISRCRGYVLLQQFKEAVADCASALQIDSSDDFGFFYRARAEVGLAQWSAAISDFNAALRLDSSDTNAYYWLAIAQLSSGAYAEALTDIDRYIKTNVDDGDGHILRAAIEAKLGNAAEARASAMTALRHFEIVNDQNKAAKAQRCWTRSTQRHHRVRPPRASREPAPKEPEARAGMRRRADERTSGRHERSSELQIRTRESKGLERRCGLRASAHDRRVSRFAEFCRRFDASAARRVARTPLACDRGGVGVCRQRTLPRDGHHSER